MYGFDTASSLAEETKDPRRTAPKAILMAIVASFLLGGAILLFAILAAPDLGDERLGMSSGGLQLIVLQALGSNLGKVFLVCVVVAITVCALAVHAATIRIAFAMARDNNLPAGSLLARVDPVRRTPVIPPIAIGVLAVLILVVNIRQPQIFTVVTSIAIILIYLAYLLVTGPMLLAPLPGYLAAARP
jgi:amino acid transporter